jgi:hypothetical protein
MTGCLSLVTRPDPPPDEEPDLPGDGLEKTSFRSGRADIPAENKSEPRTMPPFWARPRDSSSL